MKPNISNNNWCEHHKIDGGSLIASLLRSGSWKSGINLNDTYDLLCFLIQYERGMLNDPIDIRLAQGFSSDLNQLNYKSGVKRPFFAEEDIVNLKLALSLSCSIADSSNQHIHDLLEKENSYYMDPLKEKFLSFHQNLYRCFPMSLLNQVNNYSNNGNSLVLGALDSLYRALRIRFTLTYSSEPITISDLTFISRSKNTKRILNELSPSFKSSTVLLRCDTKKASVTRESALAWLISPDRKTLGLQVIDDRQEKELFDWADDELNYSETKLFRAEDDLDMQSIDKKA